MLWFKKREKNVEASEKEEINKLKAKIIRLEAEILDIATAQDIIRNKVLRKIQFKKQEEEEEKQPEWLGIPLQ